MTTTKLDLTGLKCPLPALKTRNYVRTPLDFQSASGEWWVPANNAVLRYPAVKDFKDLASKQNGDEAFRTKGLFPVLLASLHG